MYNNNTFIPQFVSVSDLQRHYASLLARLKESTQPLLVVKKNKPEAIIVQPQAYEDLVEKARRYEEQEALAAISLYTKEKKARRLKQMKSTTEFFAE